MLQRTFQLISGIGPYRERELWARGIGDWAAFEKAAAGGVVANARLDAQLLAAISGARQNLKDDDLAGLAALLPEREHFRLLPAFAGRAAYFDLEADGDREITVAGVMDSKGLATFIRGRNLEALAGRLAESPIWVTFNGRAFDVPIVRGTFAGLDKPLVHVDLRFLARTARLKGGLKAIEDTLGLARPQHLRGLKGLDAMRLWNEHQFNRRGDALQLLVEYNLYDAINLRSVLEWSLRRVSELWGFVPEASGPIFTRGDVLYDLSKLVLSV